MTTGINISMRRLKSSIDSYKTSSLRWLESGIIRMPPTKTTNDFAFPVRGKWMEDTPSLFHFVSSNSIDDDKGLRHSGSFVFIVKVI
jgi:hypothetical protein